MIFNLAGLQSRQAGSSTRAIVLLRAMLIDTTVHQDVLIKQALALQLHVPFEVGFLGHGLMTSAPDGPGDDESRIDAALDQTPGNTTDLLE